MIVFHVDNLDSLDYTWYMAWQIQEAKNKLSEVVDSSIKIGPQIITRHGKNTAVMISMEDYKRLATPKTSIKKTLMSTGFDSLDLARDKSDSGRASEFSI